MASPPACTPPTSVPIFDPTDFTSVAGQYVNYPVAQGNLTLLGVACSGITCSGSATAASLTITGAASANSLTAPQLNTTSAGVNLLVGNTQTTGNLYLGTDITNARTTGQIYLGAPITPNYTAAATSTQIGYYNQLITSGSATISATTASVASLGTIGIGVWLLEATVLATAVSTAGCNLSFNTSASTFSVQRGITYTPSPNALYMRLTAVIQNTSGNAWWLNGSSATSLNVNNVNVFITRLA